MYIVKRLDSYMEANGAGAIYTRYLTENKGLSGDRDVDIVILNV